MIQKQFLISAIILVSAVSGYTQTWERIYSGYNYAFKGIEFPGGQSQIGYAGGQTASQGGDGIVIKTTDNGTAWH